jgi:hypothetical protein
MLTFETGDHNHEPGANPIKNKPWKITKQNFLKWDKKKTSLKKDLNSIRKLNS